MYKEVPPQAVILIVPPANVKMSKKIQSKPISRVLFAVLYLKNKTNTGEQPVLSQMGENSIYLALQPLRFTMPLLSPTKRWALTPPFHPYLTSRRYIFCGTGCALAIWH
eukprot:gene3026-3781_t